MESMETTYNQWIGRTCQINSQTICIVCNHLSLFLWIVQCLVPDHSGLLRWLQPVRCVSRHKTPLTWPRPCGTWWVQCFNNNHSRVIRSVLLLEHLECRGHQQLFLSSQLLWRMGILLTWHQAIWCFRDFHYRLCQEQVTMQSTVVQPLQQMQHTPATPGPSGQSSDPSHQQQQDVAVPTPPSDPVLPSTFTLNSSRQQNIRVSDHNQTTESDQQVEEEFVSEKDYEVFWQAVQNSMGFFRSLQLTTRIIWI